MKSLLILGAGGFGHMIQETAFLLGYEDVVFLDDAVKDKDVVGKCCDYKSFSRSMIQRLRRLVTIICVSTGRRS